MQPGNVLPALVWLFLAVNQARLSPFPPAPATLGLVLINSVALVLFMVRRDATRVGGKLELVIALAGTFIVSFLKGPEARDAGAVASAVQLAALAGWAASLITLGRSFGIVPADRGLVQHGPYRFVRHPIYAFEALFFAGYLIAVPTWYSGLIIAIWCALQVTRIVREERILDGYAGYKSLVRWRVLPGVW